MGTTYFAKDGSYGDASGLVIVDTSDWDERDWDAIDRASDDYRCTVARRMSDWPLTADARAVRHA